MDMEARMFKAYAKRGRKDSAENYIGTFYNVPVPYHHYLDMTTMKTRCAELYQIGLLSAKYEATTPVDVLFVWTD